MEFHSGSRQQLQSKKSNFAPIAPLGGVQASGDSETNAEGGKQDQGNEESSPSSGSVTHADEIGETEHEKKPGPGPDQPEGLPSPLVGSATYTNENEETVVSSGVARAEAMEPSPVEPQENRAATLGFQPHAGRRVDPVHPDGQSPVEQNAASRSMDQDSWILSHRLLDRFKQFGDLAALQQAITTLEDFVRSASVRDDWYRVGLGNLGVALSYRFERLGDLSDLGEAISKHKITVDLIPDGHPDKPKNLTSLGLCFQVRFERLGELSDIEQAISTRRDAVDLIPDIHPNKRPYLANLGNSLLARFRRLGGLSDIEEAIVRHRNAVDLIPDGHPHKPNYLHDLGLCFQARFEHVGELSDLEQAIPRHRDAIDLTPDGHPNNPVCMAALGYSLQARFERVGELSDLEEAISTHSNAVDLIPDADPNKPVYLANLGHSLRARFRRLGELSDLEEAISRLRNAVDLIPDGYHDKPNHLHNLGLCFQARFERIGELSDLEQAISRHRNAIDLIPDGHPHKPACAANLGYSLQIRFERVGELSDLEQAISRHRDAVDLTPDGHPNKHAHLANLGNSLRVRFERIGELSDLEQAICRYMDVIDLIPDGHPNKPACLANLGYSLRARFQHFGKLSDLEEAISRFRNAVDRIPDGHPEKPNHVNGLGLCFQARFERVGELSDLAEAISRHRNVVDLTPDGHPNKSIFLANLGYSLKARFVRVGELSDLEEAIWRYRDAIDLTPDGHPHKPASLTSLGFSFRARFWRLGEPSDLEQAISIYSHAASTSIGPSTVRFHASLEWISCARINRHHTLLQAYSISIGLLPQLAWIGLSLTHRYRELAQGADVVREAAAAALDSGLPEIAVEWLEQGRSIVWGELFQLRSSYEELSSTHPDHAHRLRELSVALDGASATREKSSSLSSFYTESVLQQEVERHRALAIERDKLLQEIRRLPGFERFLLHKEFSQLRASAHSGPVVVLNAAESRCDALIVRADMDRVIHVPLPNFTFQRCEGLQKMLKGLLGHSRVLRCDDSEREGGTPTQRRINWEPLLSALWKGVVKPILDALDFSMPGDLSRIFWCPTGPFVFLPIHAAGLYGTQYSQPGHKVYDFVVSSYVPTVSILAPSPNPDMVPSGDLRLLAVCQPSSDGQPHLQGVDTELKYIEAVIRDSPSARTTLLESSTGTVEEVLSLMKDADWVHFACHGIQDTESPTESGLCLADERRLKISDIIALSRPHGGLAFLSACETAMGDKKLSDEAIHIAAGMLYAGYGGVVGTMWEISDKLAPRVAQDVYGQLLRKGTRPDYREAARALHEAVGRLRDIGASFDKWLPFIHVGL